MKNLFALFTTILFAHFSFAQKAMTFDEAKEKGIRVSYLDSTYKSGIHTDSTLAVFYHNQAEYIAAYQKMLQEFGVFLKAHDFTWEKPAKGFNRIYFNKDGKVDYFLYTFRPEQFTTKEQELRFGALLNLFIADYRFPLKADVNFAQCSPVTYVPETK